MQGSKLDHGRKQLPQFHHGKDLRDGVTWRLFGGILKDPLRAIAEDGILSYSIPSSNIGPPPPVSLIGSLSEKEKVVDLLGLGKSAVSGLAGKEISKS